MGGEVENLGKFAQKRYQHPDEMHYTAEEYFMRMDELEKPYTVAGLARALGFADTATLTTQYAKADGYEAFHHVVKRMLLRIEEQVTSRIVDPKRKNVPVGDIFYSKAAFGLSDKQPGEGNNINIIVKGKDARL